MGCIFSKNGQVRTLSDDVEEPLPASAFSTRGAAHAWLQEIGLPQYAEAFEDAGFSDWDLLSCLNDADLEAIAVHTGKAIPPGHRKKLLMASRQMGTSASQTAALGAPLPSGSARRYSHSSNPANGNGSRGGGLTAAAAAAASFERRSNGPHPQCASRVPSLGNVLAGQSGQPLVLLPANPQARAVTEDGVVSVRRIWPAVTLTPAYNSSRNSVSAVAAAGHAIGYIASPTYSAAQDAAAIGVGGHDPWAMADGRRSPSEPASPHAVTVAGAGGLTPPRQRRRWSANKAALRGVLVGGCDSAPISMLTSAPSRHWLEQEAAAPAAAALGVAGPITDDVRQMSVTSSISDTYGFIGGGEGGGGGGAVVQVQPLISRDLEGLVMGASGNGATNGVPSSRCQSLAATRPDKLYGGAGGTCGHGGRPPSPPAALCRISGAQPATGAGGGGSGGLQASRSWRGGIRTSMLTAAIQSPAPPPRPQQQLLHPGAPSQPQPNLERGDQQNQSQPQQPDISTKRDGTVIAPAAGGGGGSTAAIALGAIGGPPVLRRPGSAAESTKSWAIAQALPSSSPPPSSPGVAWASQAHVKHRGGGGTAAAAASSVSRSGDGDAAGTFPTSVGSPGAAALPRFVRAIAGWAIPAPSAAAPDGGAAAAAVAAASAAGATRRARSANRQRLVHVRQSSPQLTVEPLLSRTGGGGGAASPEGELSEQAVTEGGRGIPAAGDVLAVEVAAAGSLAGGAPSAEPPSWRGQQGRGGRPQRRTMLPDVLTPRGPWDQDAALCIQGRGYKPPAKAAAAAAAAAAQRLSGPSPAAARGPAGGDDDSNVLLPSSAASCPARSVPVLAPAAAAAAASGRGGGWPFVMPQLTQPARSPHADATEPPTPPLAAVTRAAGTPGAPALAQRFSSASITLGMGVGSDSGADAADDSAGPTSGSYGATVGGGSAAQYSRMPAFPDSLPSAMFESVVSDASAATTTAHRAPPMHSSRPPDWCPSIGAASEEAATVTAMEHSGSSTDDLALYGSLGQRPHRIQVVGPAVAMSSPYNGGVGAAAAQWPAMPLHPPTRAKPPPPSPQGAIANGGRGGGCGRLEVLPSEAPGPSRTLSVPPDGGGAAAAPVAPDSGGVPRPTPGRKMDLEMLADQVGRIMSHLSYIAKDGVDSDGGMITAPSLARPAAIAAAVAGKEGYGDRVEKAYISGGGGKDDDRGPDRAGGGAGVAKAAPLPQGAAAPAAAAAAAAPEAGGGAVVRRGGSRRQAIDQKRLELQHLHQDLVQRVAAMAVAADPPPPSAAAGGVGNAGAIHAAAVEDSAAAAEALAEVEARIRTKLAELAMLTMTPASARRAGGGVDGSGSSAGVSSSGVPRKRALGTESLSEPPPRAAGWNAGNYDDGSSAGGSVQPHLQRRAREEAALHMEVLAVLSARKRQVRGGMGEPAAALPVGTGGNDYNDGQLRRQQQQHQLEQQQQEIRRGGRQHFSIHVPAAVSSTRGVAVCSGRGGGGDASPLPPGGVVLAEMHDALRSELLAIDGKVKARLQDNRAAAFGRA